MWQLSKRPRFVRPSGGAPYDAPADDDDDDADDGLVPVGENEDVAVPDEEDSDSEEVDSDAGPNGIILIDPPEDQEDVPAVDAEALRNRLRALRAQLVEYDVQTVTAPPPVADPMPVPINPLANPAAGAAAAAAAVTET